VEKFNAVWIWPGDPDKADPSAIFDLPQYGKTGLGLVDGQYLHFAPAISPRPTIRRPAATSYVHRMHVSASPAARTFGPGRADEIAGGEMEILAVTSPQPACRIAGVEDRRRVGLVRIARPDPHGVEFLHQGEGAQSAQPSGSAAWPGIRTQTPAASYCMP